MSSNRPLLDRISTGSAAFDRILGGGLPIRSLNVIAGGPGAGKSLFALQMLFHLGHQGKKGLYFTTLSEPATARCRPSGWKARSLTPPLGPGNVNISWPVATS